MGFNSFDPFGAAEKAAKLGVLLGWGPKEEEKKPRRSSSSGGKGNATAASTNAKNFAQADNYKAQLPKYQSESKVAVKLVGPKIAEGKAKSSFEQDKTRKALVDSALADIYQVMNASDISNVNYMDDVNRIIEVNQKRLDDVGAGIDLRNLVMPDNKIANAHRLSSMTRLLQELTGRRRNSTDGYGSASWREYDADVATLNREVKSAMLNNPNFSGVARNPDAELVTGFEIGDDLNPDALYMTTLDDNGKRTIVTGADGEPVPMGAAVGQAHNDDFTYSATEHMRRMQQERGNEHIDHGANIDPNLRASDLELAQYSLEQSFTAYQAAVDAAESAYQAAISDITTREANIDQRDVAGRKRLLKERLAAKARRDAALKEAKKLREKAWSLADMHTSSGTPRMPAVPKLNYSPYGQ